MSWYRQVVRFGEERVNLYCTEGSQGSSWCFINSILVNNFPCSYIVPLKQLRFTSALCFVKMLQKQISQCDGHRIVRERNMVHLEDYSIKGAGSQRGTTGQNNH